MLPAFLHPPGRPSRAASQADARALATWIVDPERGRPVVVLSARSGEEDPYFAPPAVQRLVGLDGDVVSLAQTSKSGVARELARALPPGLMVFNGAARIYWPTAVAGLRPDRHPLILATSAGNSAEKRARLTSRWRQGPGVASDPSASATTDRGAGSETRAAAEIGGASDIGEASETRGASETREASEIGGASETREPSDIGGASEVRRALELAIVRAWLALLPDVADRDVFPLRPHAVHPDVVEQLEALEPARGPVAEVAARILSGYAWTQPGPPPERVERRGVPVLRTDDRAVAWRVPLPGSDRYLYYWQPAAGPITVARIAAADFTDLPGAMAARSSPGSTGVARPATRAPRPSTATTRDAAIEHAVPPAQSSGEPPRRATPRTVSPPRPTDPGGLVIADDELVRVLSAAGEPLLAPELRTALGIDPDLDRRHVSAVLLDAVQRQVIGRQGQRRGTRYFAL